MSEQEKSNQEDSDRAKIEKMKEENGRLKYRIRILEKALQEAEMSQTKLN